MNEWKVVGLVSFFVNIILVALLFFAVFFVKGMLEDKNAEVTRLEREVAMTKESLATQQKEVAAPSEEGEEELEVSEEKEEPVQEQPKVQAKPVEQTDYKQKLASYKASLTDEYDYVYYMYEGAPPIDILLQEMSNAEVADMFEEEYKKADVILNKVYGILKDTLPASEFKQLQAEQRTWLQRVTKSKEDRLAMGGSGARLDVALELGEETQERCVELMMKYFGFEDYNGD